MAITKASLKRPPNITLHAAKDSQAPQLLQLHLDSSDVSALENSFQDGKGAQLIFGRNPTLKYANTSKALHLAPAKSVHEVYISRDQSNDLTLVGKVSHDATLDQLEKTSSSAEAAAQKLRESLSAYQRDRDSNKATLVNEVKLTKHARAHSNSLSRNSVLLSPSSKGVSHSTTPAPTSVPNQNAAVAARATAQRFCLLHLLAANPSTLEELIKQTRIGSEECSRLLEKVAERVEKDCWQLKRKSYRELDVWRFPYPSDKQRQSAVTNALRAFDRDRLDPNDPIRQLLLPKAERGKGKNLSNLHIDVAEIARKKKPDSLRLGGDHRKLLGAAGSGARVKSPAAHEMSKGKKSATAKEPSPRRSHLLGHSPKPSPAVQPVKKAQAHKQTPTEAKAMPTASPATALSKSKGNEQKAAEASRAEKKRKAQPAPKSSEFIHDSDEEADEAEREMVVAKKRRMSDDEDDSRGRAATSRQTVRRPSTQPVKSIKRDTAQQQQLPPQNKDRSSSGSSPSVAASTKQERPQLKTAITNEHQRPLPQQQPSGRSRDSSTSSLSISSPLTPLDSTPRSTASSTSKRSSDLSHLEHRYHAAFKKRMRSMFSVSASPSCTPIIAEYERSALDLAAAMGVHIDDLYVPSGAHFFPAPALQSLAAKYNALFPAYQAARRRIRDGAVDGNARRKLLGEVRVLERQLKYVKGLYDAAAESQQLEVNS